MNLLQKFKEFFKGSKVTKKEVVENAQQIVKARRVLKNYNHYSRCLTPRVPTIQR